MSSPTELNPSEPYPPIHRSSDVLDSNDPFGLLPYRRRIRETEDTILHFDKARGYLVAFEWYVWYIHRLSWYWHNTELYRPLDPAGNLVSAKDWSIYRENHNFRAPSCLCVAVDPSQSYTESVIFKITRAGSVLKGQYVAACARSTCRYFGKTVAPLPVSIVTLLHLRVTETYILIVRLDPFQRRAGIPSLRYPLRSRCSSQLPSKDSTSRLCTFRHGM